jgi:hypothetical protein
MEQKTESEGAASPAESLLNLHIAEYQALTNRNTYLVTLQFSLWPVLLLFLTLVAQLWGLFDHRLLGWSTNFAIQLIGWAWLQLIWEQLNNIRYLEERLRPRIEYAHPNAAFWEYESFLAHDRRGVFLGDYWLTLIAAIGLVALPLTILLWGPFSRTDYCGFAINVIGMGFLVWKTLDLIKLRKHIWRHMGGAVK